MKENLFSLKQILFLTVLLFSLSSTSAQINFSQNFDTGSVADMGWSTSGYSLSTTNACNVRSVRGLLTSAATSNHLTSPNQVSASNGNNINVSFKYKVINLTGSGATAADFGSLQVQYSLNNGASYTTAYTINSSNHSPSTGCITVNFSIPGTSVPAGNSFRLRFLGTHANYSFYIHIDDVAVAQSTASPPNCNANLIAPTNGALNVPVTTTSLTWGTATGIPTGYKLRVGTASGASNVINNLNVGNVTTHPVSLNYSTTYYVGITPYNANGDATGCTEYSFTTAAPVVTTTPWNEGFNTTVLPNGWSNTGFTIATSSRLPGADTNLIFKNLNASAATGNFSTISVGEIQTGDELSFTYRLANFASPYNPPAAGSGNFIVSVSTDHGISYTDVQTVSNNGAAGWQNYSLDLSVYAGDYVRIKITTSRTSGDYFIGFDDFYIGQPITCATPEDLILNFAGSDTAQVSWDAISNAADYNWYVFISGADPETATPVRYDTTSNDFAHITGLSANTDYDFYVEANCGVVDGLSQLSEALPFITQCESINSFPFTETFEDNSASRDCWIMEYVSGTTDWAVHTGAARGNIQNAHSGSLNALFFLNSYAVHKTKLISPSLNISNMNEPKLSFWYANEEGSDSTEQNELRIYYKTSVGASWILLPNATYNSNINVWTYVELDLPQGSDDYYIAFEGTNHFGEGIVIDDVTISDFDACPVTIWDGIAWNNGVPDINKKAIINGNLVLNNDLEACELEVTANGSLEIPAGLSFTVNGLITNHSTAENFIVSNDANLIQNNDVNNIGEITVLRDGKPFKRLDYTLWSSPVNGQELQQFSPSTLPARILTYEGSSGYIAVPSATSNFTEAKGYLFRAPNNWSSNTPMAYPGKFIGVPFNGTVNINTYAGNYTSVGNPYPSNISADELMSVNSGVSTLYFWTNVNPVSGGSYSGNNYATYTFIGGSSADGGSDEPNGFISTGQGFIVETSGSSIEFNNTMRAKNDAVFFRGETAVERHRFWLSFKDINNNALNGILIGYMTGATNGIDNQIDGRLFGYNGSALYSVIEGEKFTNQGRALPFETTDVVQLGIRIITAGQFVVNLRTMDGLFLDPGQTIYLHDKYLNVIHSLNDGDYVFQSEAGEFNDRFDIVYEASNCPSQTIWDGILWSNGLPDTDKKAVIAGTYTLSSDLEACELEVTQNGSLEIPTGFSFTVNGVVINHASPADFLVASGGNLVQNQDVENTGAITVIRNSQPMKRLDYTLWSSPVADQNLFGFSPNTVNGVTNYPGSTGRIYIYDGSNGYINPDPFTAQAVMNEATGYLFRSPNNYHTTNQTVYEGIFTGVANNGNIAAATVAGNYTSIGNPYPSNIDADLLITTNPGISALYFWNNTGNAGNNYATYTTLGGTSAGEGYQTPDGIISVGQGFIVQSTAGSVNFDNTMRVTTPANFFKGNHTERHRIWLDLTNENNEKHNQILVGYMSGATNEIDNQIDGKQFGYEGSSLYSIIGEEKFSVQGRALPFETSDVVKLGFKAEEAGKFTVSLANFDGLFSHGEVTVYLRDHQANIYHNLMESDYIFESDSGDFKERFEIVYEEESTMGTGELTNGAVQIYKQDQNIVVESKTEKILSVELFDLNGRNIHRNQQVNANRYQIRSHSKSVLIVKVQTQNGKVVSKKVLNK